ncbi:MAG: 6-phosphofructokinase [Gammaproteobacteria bacterium]|nr:6-phosphofructokinase [Gammaproteobacteria bacterium]
MPNPTKQSPQHIFYAHSGGVTPVINATACGVIETARKMKSRIGKVYAGKDGIIGALTEELIDTSKEPHQFISALKQTPGSAFGTARYKLKDIDENRAQYERLVEVFKAHDIGYFLYNGGNDSMDTALKVSKISKALDYPITCVGVPKTIDNDLCVTDCCPGFGSVAKYIAISTKEAAMDVASMARTSTKVFVLEVMGRHAGWLAAASGLAGSRTAGEAPHIILFPEIAFNRELFIEKVQQCVERYGYCVIVASEGARDLAGNFLAEASSKDAFGHTQLGGVAPTLAGMIKTDTGFKYHWAVSDYLQRSARHIASQMDLDHAYAVGKSAVELVINGNNGVMPAIVRHSDQPYRWGIGVVKLERVANHEKTMPRHFISRDGFGITAACKRYLSPLIRGEAYPTYRNGLPKYTKLKNILVGKKLKTDFSI